MDKAVGRVWSSRLKPGRLDDGVSQPIYGRKRQARNTPKECLRGYGGSTMVDDESESV